VTQLSDLYDADKALTLATVGRLRSLCYIPHPLHGVDYADGVILCGRQSCEPCRAYRGEKPWGKVQVEYDRRRGEA
jgi:hypothetical protein